MAAFVQLDAAQLRGVTVFYVDESGMNAATEEALHRAGHGRSSLARADHVDIGERLQTVAMAAGFEDFTTAAHMAQDGLTRVGGGDRGMQDRERGFAGASH